MESLSVKSYGKTARFHHGGGRKSVRGIPMGILGGISLFVPGDLQSDLPVGVASLLASQRGLEGVLVFVVLGQPLLVGGEGDSRP